MAKGVLNGDLPSRPLLLPIVFSLGAKVENVPLNAFLNNPTKIVSALRQMRSHLHADGVACYFDPYLEVEALGATLERKSEDQPPVVHWQHSARVGKLPEGLRSSEEAVQNGRIPVAAEVIRRMNSVPNRDFLLQAHVSGPIALAAQIAQVEKQENWDIAVLLAEVLELASSVVTQTVTAFLEAGADLVVINERPPNAITAKSWEEWVNLLSPAINVTRFYEALPVLLLAGSNAVLENWDMIGGLSWDCVLCGPASVLSKLPEGICTTQLLPPGIALPLELFLPGSANEEDSLSKLNEAIAKSRLAIITTAGGVPFAADLKHLRKIFGEIARPV